MDFSDAVRRQTPARYSIRHGRAITRRCYFQTTLHLTQPEAVTFAVNPSYLRALLSGIFTTQPRKGLGVFRRLPGKIQPPADWRVLSLLHFLMSSGSPTAHLVSDAVLPAQTQQNIPAARNSLLVGNLTTKAGNPLQHASSHWRAAPTLKRNNARRRLVVAINVLFMQSASSQSALASLTAYIHKDIVAL